MYERELKEQRPEKRDLIYDVKDLFAYLDQLADITALVYAATLCANASIEPHASAPAHHAQGHARNQSCGTAPMSSCGAGTSPSARRMFRVIESGSRRSASSTCTACARKK